MKTTLLSIIGVVGAGITTIFGGWDMALTTLVIFMAIDYGTGLLTAAAFKASKKTETGALESKSCFKGLIRKGMILVLVLVAYRLDLAMGTNYLRDAVCIAFIANETISIIENAGLMGIPVPAVLSNAIDVLTKANNKKINKDKDEEQ